MATTSRVMVAFGDIIWWVKSTPSDEAIHARGWIRMTVFDESHSRKGSSEHRPNLAIISWLFVTFGDAGGRAG